MKRSLVKPGWYWVIVEADGTPIIIDKKRKAAVQEAEARWSIVWSDLYRLGVRCKRVWVQKEKP